MRPVLRPVRLGVVGVCLLLLLGLVAAPSVAGPAGGGDRDYHPLFPYGFGLRTSVH